MTIDYRRFSCYDTEYTEAEDCFRTFFTEQSLRPATTNMEEEYENNEEAACSNARNCNAPYLCGI